MLILPNKWTKKVFKERRFRPDYGETKSLYSQTTQTGKQITEDESYVRGYRDAIKDIKLLNK